MKAGQLKARLADAMCIPESWVNVTMRNIREAQPESLLTTGARGVNAPDMTYLDASRILIAHILEDNPGRRSVHYVKTFGALPWYNRDFAYEGDPFTIQELLPGVPFDTLERALAALIQVFAEGHAPAGDDGLHPRCRAEISPRDEWARIVMQGAGYDFGRLAESWSPVDDEESRLGRQSICFINQEVIAHVANGFAEDEGGE